MPRVKFNVELEIEVKYEVSQPIYTQLFGYVNKDNQLVLETKQGKIVDFQTNKLERQEQVKDNG